jgi:hypothetical protein
MLRSWRTVTDPVILMMFRAQFHTDAAPVDLENRPLGNSKQPAKGLAPVTTSCVHSSPA